MSLYRLAVLFAMTAGPAAAADPVAVRFPDRVEACNETRDRLQRAYTRLCSPPLDDPEFVLSDVTFRQKRRFTEYSGDISGRMLGALNAAAPLLGAEAPMIDILLGAFPRYQKPDGHFGADQDLAAGVNQTRDMPILWGNGRLLLALVERYRSRPDEQVLAMAKRLGEYMLSTRPYYGKRENFERVGGQYASGFTTCYPSLIDGLAALGEVTRDKRFFEEARFIARLSLLDNAFARHHSHGRLTAYRGMLDVDRFTEGSEFLGAVRSGCATISAEYLLPTGGITEQFDRTDVHDEGCTEGDWIRVNLLLWQATGDPMYLDAAEHCLRNHLMAVQFANGGFGHWVFRPLRDGDRSYPGGAFGKTGTEAYWCCSMHGVQILADVARWGVVVADDKVCITWLAEVRAVVRVGGQEVSVTAKREEPNVWTVWVRAANPAAVTLRLRVPGWAESITVNGELHRPQAGWSDMTLKAAEKSSQVLLVRMPAVLRKAGVYDPPAKADGAARLFAGADLLCLPDVQLAEGLASPDAVPTVYAVGGAAEKGEVPVVVEGVGGKSQRAILVPMARRPTGECRYLFRVREVDQADLARREAEAAPMPARGTPMELCLTCDGSYEAYLDGRLVARANGLNDARVQVWAKSPPKVLALKVRSGSKRPAVIGILRIGNRTVLTQPDGWTAAACPERLSADWLTDIGIGREKAVGLADLGGFGSPPWDHLNGQFAGTQARWVWPETAGAKPDTWWLLRTAISPD